MGHDPVYTGVRETRESCFEKYPAPLGVQVLVSLLQYIQIHVGTVACPSGLFKGKAMHV